MPILTKIEEWDTKVFLSIYKSKFSKRTKDFAKVYSFFGNIYFWGSVWLAMGIYGYITKDYYLFKLFTGAFHQGFFLYIIIRYKLVNRNRPFITLEGEGVEQHDKLIAESKSFPSGHVTFLLYFGFVFAFHFNNGIILLIFFILDIIMALTRLILGVHFPTDVIFGFVFGFLFALLYLGLTYPYWIIVYNWIGDTFSWVNPQNWF